MCLGCGTAVMQVYGSSGRVCCQGPVSTAWMCADAAATHEHVVSPWGPVNCCLGFCPSPSVCTWCRCTAGWELSSENRPALNQPCSTVHTPRVHIHAHALPLAGCTCCRFAAGWDTVLPPSQRCIKHWKQRQLRCPKQQPFLAGRLSSGTCSLLTRCGCAGDYRWAPRAAVWAHLRVHVLGLSPYVRACS